MERNIKFLKQFTVDVFKREQGSTALDVIPNAATGKVFFACGTATGKVSKQISSTGKTVNPIVSWCESPEEEAPFWMLHEKGEGIAPMFTL